MRRLLPWSLLLVCLALSACGFTLRGSADLPPQFSTLLLETNAGNTDLFRDMRRALEASQVNVVEAPTAGIYRLGIGQEQIRERVLSVNSNARAGEYELTMSVPFQLRDSSNAFVIPTETLSIERVYLADPDNAVAKAEEADLIRDEMRRQLVVLILRRLQNATLSP